MKKFAFTLSLAFTQLANTALAHDGHGLSGTHWHATDVMGFIAVAAVLAVAVYFGKK